MSKNTGSTSKIPEQDLVNLTWESSVVQAREVSEKRAWKVTFVSMFLAIGCVAALALSMPLRQTITRIVEVDKLTGETSVVSDLPAYVSSRNDINDKHWVKRFLIAHERYDFKILQSDFDTVKILSSPATYAKYSSRFSGPNAMHEKLTDTVEVIPTVLSITLPSNNIATVRFEVVTSSTKGSTKPETLRYIATMGYHYSPNIFAKEKDLIDNPLGFYVDSIQIDPEVVTTTDKAKLSEEIQTTNEVTAAEQNKKSEPIKSSNPLEGTLGLKMSPRVPAIGDKS